MLSIEKLRVIYWNKQHSHPGDDNAHRCYLSCSKHKNTDELVSSMQRALRTVRADYRQYRDFKLIWAERSMVELINTAMENEAVECELSVDQLELFKE